MTEIQAYGDQRAQEAVRERDERWAKRLVEGQHDGHLVNFTAEDAEPYLAQWQRAVREERRRIAEAMREEANRVLATDLIVSDTLSELADKIERGEL